MVKFYNDMLDQFGAGKDDADAPDGADAKNRATVAMKGAVKEEFSKLFSADETLTEESKDKLSTLFEAAVNSQVSIALEEIRADVATKINELEEAYAEVVEEEVVQNDEIGEWKVEELPISKRSKTGLLAGGFKTVADLRNTSSTELLNLPGFGNKSLNGILELLTE